MCKMFFGFRDNCCAPYYRTVVKLPQNMHNITRMEKVFFRFPSLSFFFLSLLPGMFFFPLSSPSAYLNILLCGDQPIVLNKGQSIIVFKVIAICLENMSKSQNPFPLTFIAYTFHSNSKHDGKCIDSLLTTFHNRIKVQRLGWPQNNFYFYWSGFEILFIYWCLCLVGTHFNRHRLFQYIDKCK